MITCFFYSHTSLPPSTVHKVVLLLVSQAFSQQWSIISLSIWHFVPNIHRLQLSPGRYAISDSPNNSHLVDCNGPWKLVLFVLCYFTTSTSWWLFILFGKSHHHQHGSFCFASPLFVVFFGNSTRTTIDVEKLYSKTKTENARMHYVLI